MSNPELNVENPESKDTQDMPQKITKKKVLKVVFLVVLIIFVILAVINRNMTEALFADFLQWMAKYPAIGALAYIGIYMMTAVLLIPGSILTLGAGFVYFRLYGIVKFETHNTCTHTSFSFNTNVKNFWRFYFVYIYVFS